MPLHLIDWHIVEDYLWWTLIELAQQYRQAGRNDRSDAARGKSLGMLFFNPSLRTRTSMELAATHLGAHATTLVPGQGTWNFAWEDGAKMKGDAAEHIREAVGVLSRYYDALGVRLFASMTNYEQDREETLLHRVAAVSEVPVINLESAFYHPCQALADAATLMTHFKGDVAGKKFVLAWTTHPKALPMAVPNSALLMAARMGMHVVVARPKEYALDEMIMDRARAYAALNGVSVTETDSLTEGVEDAHVIYAKSWGGELAYLEPDEEHKIRRRYHARRITPRLMEKTDHAAFMHCLPVRRGVVVDDAVLDGPNALHLLQSEFRLYAQKAILEYIWDL